ncbi:MAG: hypothetical protein LBP32_01695 [Spirochaetaceae bacterium]|jgi:hypothetical protein|nr:hypothetical protein [Spirochaetaceae bacterium]
MKRLFPGLFLLGVLLASCDLTGDDDDTYQSALRDITDTSVLLNTAWISEYGEELYFFSEKKLSWFNRYSNSIDGWDGRFMPQKYYFIENYLIIVSFDEFEMRMSGDQTILSATPTGRGDNPYSFIFHKTAYPDFLSATITGEMLTGTWYRDMIGSWGEGDTIIFNGDGTLTRPPPYGVTVAYNLENNILVTSSGDIYTLIMPDKYTLIFDSDTASPVKYRRRGWTP